MSKSSFFGSYCIWIIGHSSSLSAIADTGPVGTGITRNKVNPAKAGRYEPFAMIYELFVHSGINKVYENTGKMVHLPACFCPAGRL
jgi:hypothetical protein